MSSTRPTLHFTCRDGWINDPLGLTWHDGQYHLFFQYVPQTQDWAPQCHWGHCTSPTLTGWQEQDIALAPGDGDDGVWSGSLTIDDAGQTRIFYTAVSTPDYAVGRVRVATPDDPAWNTWNKGPVVVTAPESTAATAFRDPFVFRDAGKWRMLVATALPGNIGAASCFSSTDLERWTFEGLAASRSSAEREGAWTGSLWECPQLLELDGQHYLIMGVWEDDQLHHVAYACGTWSEAVFTAESWHQLTHGSSYYAPSLFRDKEGNPGIIFWLRNASGPDWTGALSIPYLIEATDGKLRLVPHPDVTQAADASTTTHATILEWNPADNDLLIQTDQDILISRQGDLLAVECGGELNTLVPCGPGNLTVIADGPICEVALGLAVYAVASASDVRVSLVAKSPPND